MNPVSLMGSREYNSAPYFSLFFLSIYLHGSYSTFLSLYHSSYSVFLPEFCLSTNACTRTHTHTHTITPPPSELSERGGGEARSSAFWELGFYFFKGLSGPLVCMADRLDLIFGLIQSVCQLHPARPSPAHHGTALMPLCVLLVAKYTQDTIPNEVVYRQDEGLCVSSN